VLIPKSIKDKGLTNEFLSIIKKSKDLETSENNCYYRLVAASFPVVTTLNARELVHFFKLRLCERAQWEIRDIAEKMLTEVKQTKQSIFDQIGPSCVILGYCPEGTHTCGKIEVMKKKYLK
jgi:thymidylate synthase (FAD)